jgi:hypothetical protein
MGDIKNAADCVAVFAFIWSLAKEVDWGSFELGCMTEESNALAADPFELVRVAIQ